MRLFGFGFATLGLASLLTLLNTSTTEAGPSRNVIPATCDQSSVSFGLCWSGGSRASDLRIAGQFVRAVSLMEKMARDNENLKAQSLRMLRKTGAAH